MRVLFTRIRYCKGTTMGILESIHDDQDICWRRVSFPPPQVLLHRMDTSKKIFYTSTACDPRLGVRQLSFHTCVLPLCDLCPRLTHGTALTEAPHARLVRWKGTVAGSSSLHHRLCTPSQPKFVVRRRTNSQYC